MTEQTSAAEAVSVQPVQALQRANLRERHIVYVGFMGAGKSTLAQLTAEGIDRQAFDVDGEIVRRTGRSIEETFAAGEEPLFRTLELEVTTNLLRRPPAVIALGGGALENEELRRRVFAESFVIHLAVTWRDVLRALPELKRTRPLLQGRTDAEIHHLFLRRQRAYRQAHLRVSAPRGSVAATAAELIALLSSDRP